MKGDTQVVQELWRCLSRPRVSNPLTSGLHSNEAVLYDVNATHSVFAPEKEHVIWTQALAQGLRTEATH